MSDRVNLTMPDGAVVPIVEDVSFNIRYSTEVALDGKVLDIGIAYRMLLTYREWAAQKLERMSTEIADLKQHRDNCPLAQQEADEQK